MKAPTLLATLLLCSALAPCQSAKSALGDSNLRGVSAPTENIVWVSGSKGTIARTGDGGKTWQRLTPPKGAEAFDFRDIEAANEKTAYLMSAGPGDQSRIWKTTDGGSTWREQYTNGSPDFFLDSLACWQDMQHCVALSDPVLLPGERAENGGKFLVLITDDGEHWRTLPRDHMPPALVATVTTLGATTAPGETVGKQVDVKEGAFAASGTAITVLGNNIWFGTGGPVARVFHTADRGKTWTVAETPIMHGEASQGIFSIAFRDAMHGVIVGGDYKQPDKTGANAAFTNDGGKTWRLRNKQPAGYRSAVQYGRECNAGFAGQRVGPRGTMVVTVGPNGGEVSFIDWAIRATVPHKSLNSANFALPCTLFAVGESGTVFRQPVEWSEIR